MLWFLDILNHHFSGINFGTGIKISGCCGLRSFSGHFHLVSVLFWTERGGSHRGSPARRGWRPTEIILVVRFNVFSAKLPPLSYFNNCTYEYLLFFISLYDCIYALYTNHLHCVVCFYCITWQIHLVYKKSRVCIETSLIDLSVWLVVCIQ